MYVVFSFCLFCKVYHYSIDYIFSNLYPKLRDIISFDTVV